MSDTMERTEQIEVLNSRKIVFTSEAVVLSRQILELLADEGHNAIEHVSPPQTTLSMVFTPGCTSGINDTFCG
jgi:hypothetical protein